VQQDAEIYHYERISQNVFYMTDIALINTYVIYMKLHIGNDKMKHFISHQLDITEDLLHNEVFPISNTQEDHHLLTQQTTNEGIWHYPRHIPTTGKKTPPELTACVQSIKTEARHYGMLFILPSCSVTLHLLLLPQEPHTP
jgi:hypothetical protein